MKLEDGQLRELRATLARAVARVCPRWLESERNDLVQTAVLRVADAVERGEEDAVPGSSYLSRVAYTVTVDAIRKARRIREDAVEPDRLDRQGVAHAADPERAALAREIGDEIADCLGRLVEPRRLAVQLHLYGFGLKESAALLGWPDKRTDNLLYRGLADLRRCLSGKGLEP